MIYKQILGPIVATVLGALFGLFVPGEYAGHRIAIIGWIICVAGIAALFIVVAMVIRQQNIDREVSKNMLGSNRTRVLYGDRQDRFTSDDMVDR